MARKRSPLIISVVGTSGSGKTATIAYLTNSLTKLGFRVGVAKHIHREGFTIDTEGKDTWKHAKAGARVVIGASPNELAVIKKITTETKFEEIREILRTQNLDLALLEGFSTATEKRKLEVHRIISAKNLRDLKYTLTKVAPPILAITGLVARNSKRIESAPAQVLDIPKEGPLLTSTVRRLLRPKEITNLFNEASRSHGGKCIGLAIGVRAAYIASSVFGHNPSSPDMISCRTKHCIAEAFKTIYPKSRVRVEEIRNDQIWIKSRKAELLLQLAPKNKTKFSGTRQVLRTPEKTLFTSVNFTSL